MFTKLTIKHKVAIIFWLLFAIVTIVFIFFRDSIYKTTFFSAGAWVKSFFSIADQKYFNLLEDYGSYNELADVVDSDDKELLWSELQMEDVVKDNNVFGIALLNKNEEIIANAGNFKNEMITSELGKIGDKVAYYNHFKYFKYYNDSLFSIYAVAVKRTDKTLNKAGGLLLAIGYIPNMVEQILPIDLWNVEYVNNIIDLKQSFNPVIINHFLDDIDNHNFGVLQFQFSGSNDTIGKNFWMWYGIIIVLLITGYFFITRKRNGKNELNLEQEYLKMKTLFETVPAKVYAKNQRGVFDMVNSNFAKNFGLTPDDFKNKAPRRFNLPNELLTILEEDKQIFENEKAVLLQMRYLSCFEKQGKCYSISKIPYSYDGKSIDGVMCSIMDISEGKRNEEDILEKNRMFQNTIDNLTDLYLRIDLSGKIQQASKSCCEVFGYNNVNEIIGKMVTSVVETSINFSEIERTKSIKGLSFKLKNHLDKVFYCEANINPFYNNENIIAGYEGIIHNITNLKQYEQQLKSLTENLMNSLEQTEEKKNQLENIHRSMEESLTYAKRIQDAIFSTSTNNTSVIFPDSFVLYSPREIVGGDFYYITNIEDIKVCVVADCTGHGVPGALMSVLSASLLSDIINTDKNKKEFSPAALLESLRSKIIETLQNSVILRDGLDIAVIFAQNNQIVYAGANIPLVIVHNNKTQIYEPTKCPIGIYPIQLDFKNEIISTTHNDMIYIATDGYSDQFGISENRKYSRTDFYVLLSKIANQPCNNQKEYLENELLKWRGSRKQTDDITVFGFRV